MRVFIAIDINDEVQKSIGGLQKKLQGEVSFDKGVKWVRPEIMHLTLKFLGEVKDDIINDICKLTGRVAAGYSAFNLDIEKVGHFGSLPRLASRDAAAGGKSARVLWVGTGDGSEQLAQIAGDLDEQFQALGFASQTRQFTGHLTLCRIKNSRMGIELAKAAQQYSGFRAGCTIVDSITVYQSRLDSSGPVYTALANFSLRE